MARDPVAPALVAWINAAASKLGVPAPPLRVPAWRRSAFSASHSGRVVRGVPSAPISLLADLWRNDPVLERICFEPAGRWNEVLALIRCDGAAHDAWLALVDALVAAGELDEGRLTWLHAMDIHDRDDRRDARFDRLFPTLPRAGRGSPDAGSAAAYLTRQLGLLKRATAVDELIIANDLYQHVGEALIDLRGGGAREARFARAVEDTIVQLALGRSLAVRDVTRLLRMQFARTRALATGV